MPPQAYHCGSQIEHAHPGVFVFGKLRFGNSDEFVFLRTKAHGKPIAAHRQLLSVAKRGASTSLLWDSLCLCTLHRGVLTHRWLTDSHASRHVPKQVLTESSESGRHRAGDPAGLLLRSGPRRPALRGPPPLRNETGARTLPRGRSPYRLEDTALSDRLAGSRCYKTSLKTSGKPAVARRQLLEVRETGRACARLRGLGGACEARASAGAVLALPVSCSCGTDLPEAGVMIVVIVIVI